MGEIFSILASTNDSGYTKKMLDCFLTEISGNYTSTVLNAYKDKVACCTGCMHCKESPHCVYDDYTKYDNGFRTCDVLLIATPVYNLSFPAPLKAVFDRTQIYYHDRFVRNIKPAIKKHKRAVLLLTMGRDDPDAVRIVEKQLKMIFTLLNATLTDRVVLANTDTSPDISTAKEEIKRIARDIISA